MSLTRVCEDCGATLPIQATEGLCPRCLLRAGLLSVGEPCGEDVSPGSSPSLTPGGILGGSGPPPPPTAKDDQVTRPRRFGDYELLEQIASGGMGTVYKARQVSLNRVVAVKALPFGTFTRDTFIKRFRAEAEAVAKLHHPNIVAIHEVGEHEGQPYFSMDYVDGPNLAEIERDQPLAIERSVRIARTIAEAVHYAHGMGILHRDIKPSNILIDLLDQPHITDFGLAKDLSRDSDLTLTGQTLGTPNYIPPEQIDGRRGAVGPHSDVYSLGAVLYHLLTGRPPFVGESLTATLQQVATADPVMPRLLNPAIPRDLETICLKCLEKEPSKRCRSAQEFADELGRWQRNEPIHARPIGSSERAWRWCRRKPVLAGLSASVALLLLILSVGAPIALVRINREKNRAERNLIGQYVSNGNRLVDRGSLFEALPWYVAALKQSENAGLPNVIHRRRLAAVLQQCPSPVRIWLQDQKLSYAAFSPDGRWAAVCEGGWEWDLKLDSAAVRVWDISTGVPVGAPMTHPGAIFNIAFSPNGKLIAASGADGTARVWHVESGQLAFAPLVHSNFVNRVVFSRDGRRIATASRDNSARVWDALSGNSITPPLTHWQTVWDLVFSADGESLFTAAGDVYAWDVGTAKLIPEIKPMRHSNYVERVSLSSDGRRLATASTDLTARVWDAATGEPVTPPLVYPKQVSCVAFSPDGQRLAAGCADGSVRLWNAETGAPLTPVFGHSGWVNWVAFSPDGQRLVTCSKDQSARIWDAFSGEALSGSIPHADEVMHAVFSPDGSRVLTASRDRSARLFELALREIVVRHNNRMTDLSFSPNGRFLLTASYDDTARIWNATNGTALPPLKHRSGVKSATFSHDSRHIVTASMDATAVIWDAATGRASLPPLRHEDGVLWACFSPDDRRVASAGLDRAVRLWDASLGVPVCPPLRHPRELNHVSFSPDGTRVIAACRDGTATVWEVSSGRQVLPPLRHTDWVVRAWFSPDGKRLLTISTDETARLWDAATGNPIGPQMHHAQILVDGAFSSSGQKIVTASHDNTARVWDGLTGMALTPPLQHADLVPSAAISADGERVLTACFDGTARLWDANLGEAMSSPLRHFSRVMLAVWGNDGRRFVTADELAAHIWEMPEERRSADDLDQLIRLTTSSYVNDAGRAEFVTPEGLRQIIPDVLARRLLQPPRNTEQLIQWHTREAEYAEIQGRWLAAAFHVDRLLAADPANPNLRQRIGELLANHERGMSRSVRIAGIIPIAPHAVLPRDPSTSPDLLDLTPYFNYTLTDGSQHHGLSEWNNLSGFPRGVHTFGGTAFDLRGRIGLSKVLTFLISEVRGIGVGRACRRIHFLCASHGEIPPSTLVAKIIFHLANGEATERTIVQGREVGDVRFFPSDPPLTPSAQVAAATTNGLTAAHGTMFRLFRVTWDSPLPDQPVEHVDIRCESSSGYFSIFAITVEP